MNVAYINQAFIPLYIDIAKQGRGLARKFEVRFYPTIFIADCNGKVLTVIEGYRRPIQFREILRRAFSKKKSP